MRYSSLIDVISWRQKNPQGSKTDCFKETGISYPTVCKHWNRCKLPVLPPIAERVQQWKLENPEGTKKDCSRTIGISYGTVLKYWDKKN